MAATVLGVILDSSVLIEAERRRLDVAMFLRELGSKIGEREVALSAMTVAELAHGIVRANTPERRERRRMFLDDLKAAVPVHPFTDSSAELLGKISGELSIKGSPIAVDDLLIGVCALERGYGVATLNRRHFEKIPGLTLVQI